MSRLAWSVVMALLFLSGPLMRAGLFGKLVEYRAVSEPRRAAALESHSPPATALDSALGATRDSSFYTLARAAAGVTARRLHYEPVDACNAVEAWNQRGVNCLGYSALFAASLNHLLRRVGLSGRYRARVVTGRLVLLGWDFQLWGPFRRRFPSHEYNCVEELRNGRVCGRQYMDANLYDYTGVLSVRERRDPVMR